MSRTIAVSTSQQLNLAFVIRLNWDEVSGEWRILLKQTHGEDMRLFRDMESMLVYLETVMQKVNVNRCMPPVNRQ